MRSPHPRDGARDRRGVSFGERAPSKSQTLNVAPARAGGYPVSRPAEIAARARPSGAETDARARRGRPRGRPRADEPEASLARDPRRRARPAAASLFVDDHQFLGYRRGQQAGDRVVASSDFACREFAAADAEARTRARASRGPRRPTRPPRARRAPRARRRRRRRSRAGVLGADGLHHPRRSQKRGHDVQLAMRQCKHVGRQSAHELEWGVSGL